MSRQYPYPRFDVWRASDGWHVWWIPRQDCIKPLRTWPTAEEAWAYIDYLTHREPS